ncbi:MAG: Uma2 family endonuclease [Candidatus Binatia bacterium]|jgi:Uma2 family endonuclease
MSSRATVAVAPATKADLEALPDNVVGEIIDGVLYTAPRPRSVHANVIGLLLDDLKSPFQRGRGGPGGWWILSEPGIELPDSPEFVPDLAGWLRERLPVLPVDQSITVVPDWICEILFPSTRSYDQRIKRPFYARIGVQHVWFIDLEARTLTVSRLVDGRWLEIGLFGENDTVHAEPFEAVAVNMTEWWEAGEAPKER